jgi:ribosomal protein S18 acetylase RimI-like enzyme
MLDRGSDDVVRLIGSQGKVAIETLVRAFRDKLPLLYYFPDEAERKRIASHLMSLAVLPSLRYGEVHASSPNMEGIAVWMPSDIYPISIWKLLRSAPLSVIVGFGKHGGYKMKDLGQYIDTLHGRLAPFKHIYLQSIGVDPRFQGKGHAGRLLRHMLYRMDAAGLPCYLETLEEKNVRLYEHFGFVVVHESTIPGPNLTNWAMLRRPNQATSVRTD